MSSVNKVILIGNVGKDPEFRFLPDGTKVANFSVATSESWKDKNTGEKKERTEWHTVSVMNERLSDLVEKYVKKGSKLYVEGQLQTRKWTDKNGQDRYSTEVLLSRFRGELTLLDSRDKSDSFQAAPSQTPPAVHSPTLHSNYQSAPVRTPHTSTPSDLMELIDDDIPF